MKRNVIISGEFQMTELTNNAAAQQSSKRKTAADRIAALKAAGVDISNYFPMGEEMVVKVVDGVPVQVMDDDPIYRQIENSGSIGHYKLFRRWVMAQMFRMLRSVENGCSMSRLIQNRGYEYSWKMLEKELLDQYKMHKHGDTECFEERNRWFNRDVAGRMVCDYMHDLDKYLLSLKVKHCKRMPYVTVQGTHIFTKDLNTRIIKPIETAATRVIESKTPQQLYFAVKAFNACRVKLRSNTKMSPMFIDAYKGSGAFFTCKNLILFHGARFQGQDTERKSLSFMLSKAKAYKEEGWRMVGVMKQLISDSGISVQAKIDEWR